MVERKPVEVELGGFNCEVVPQRCIRHLRDVGLPVAIGNHDDPLQTWQLCSDFGRASEAIDALSGIHVAVGAEQYPGLDLRSEEHTSELQSQSNLVCRLLLEKKKKNK